MSDWYNDVAAEWKTVALATLTEIAAPQYYTVTQALQQNTVSEALKAGQGDTSRVSPPYLFVRVGTDAVPQDVGPDGRYYRLAVDFYYLAVATGDSALDTPAYCRSRLEALRVALQTQSNLTKSQWLGDDGEIDSSEDVAFADENMFLYAAQLSFKTGFLTKVT